MSVKHALLSLLEQEPMYGYQLRQEFEARTGGTWPLNVGQVYTTLTRLERDGLVEPAAHDEAAGPDGDDATRTATQTQVRYRLTDAGRDEVASWFTTPVTRRRRRTSPRAYARSSSGPRRRSNSMNPRKSAAPTPIPTSGA